jgi:hypothetical protein
LASDYNNIGDDGDATLAEKASLSEEDKRRYLEGDLYTVLAEEQEFRPGQDLLAISADLRRFFFPHNIT